MIVLRAFLLCVISYVASLVAASVLTAASDEDYLIAGTARYFKILSELDIDGYRFDDCKIDHESAWGSALYGRGLRI